MHQKMPSLSVEIYTCYGGNRYDNVSKQAFFKVWAADRQREIGRILT